MAFDASAAERKRQDVQVSLDASMAREERISRGQFGTPPKIALEMARYAASVLGESQEPIHFGEPFLGTGAFYSALRSSFPAERIASAVGIEIDAAVAKAAAGLWRDQGVRIIQGDLAQVLRLAPELIRPNLMLADPPAFKHGQLKSGYRSALEEQTETATGLRVTGLAPYYIYAFLLACQWLDEGGLAVWLIPADFMSEGYGEILKKYLTERVTLLRVHRFDPKAAGPDDTWTASAVVAFRRAPPADSASVQFSFRGTLEEPVITQMVALQDLIGNPLWTSYPFVRVQFEADRPVDSGNASPPVLGS